MTTAKARHAFAVRLAAGIAGYCAFINLYSPQSILPLLSEEFGASAAGISTIITVSTLAVALTAPFTGTVADVLGRKRVIVVAMFALVIPTIMVGLSTSLPAMIFWRAVQGLVLPPIFAVMVAYIGDELPHHEATTVAGIYSSGSSLGGFSGRLFVGLLADLVSWRAGFMVLAAIAFVGGIIVAFLLPHERKFVRSEGLLSSGKQMLAHLRNRQLIATYAVGFGVLFNFITTFTYVSFYLAAASLQSFGELARRALRRLPCGVAAHTVDRLGCRKIRSTTIHGARYCNLGCRHRADARTFAATDHCWACDQRRLRPDLPGDFDRLCHRHGEGRPFVCRRALCDVILCRRQFWRSSRWPRLEFRRLAGLRRTRCGYADDHVGDRDFRLGASCARFNRRPSDRAAMTLSARSDAKAAYIHALALKESRVE